MKRMGEGFYSAELWKIKGEKAERYVKGAQ